MRDRWIAPMMIRASILLLVLLPAGAAEGQITRMELDVAESPALDGESFGEGGAYERLRGTAWGEVDPSDPRHAGIVNLDRAPLNDRGRVEYRTTVEIWRPVDMARWNRVLYHTVPNRGGVRRPERALLERGLAFVQVGWQGDIEPTDRNIVPVLPVARNPDGSPVVGEALEEFIFNDDDRVSIGRLSYPAASLDPERASLTVRERQFDERQAPADLRWAYEGSGAIRIERPDGFSGGAIYEFVYPARDPIVMGLGFAAMRDVISFLRYESEDGAGAPNPLLAPSGDADVAGGGAAPDGTDRLAEHALSIGISQSGRYLRDMLYQGFNEDLEGRIVFDGMHPDIAGSRKTFTNYAFGQPGRWQKQHEDHVYPGDQFPFTYATLTDPVSGRTDGLLEACSRSDTCPRIVHTDGEAEIFQARSSLLVTDTEGAPIELPENVRVYLIAGTEHGGGRGVHVEDPGRGYCANPGNPMPLGPIRTAITVALLDWVADGVEPPESRFPSRADGGWVDPAELDYPDVPGTAAYPGFLNRLHAMDHSVKPPERGEEYPVFAGRVDADGNMFDGVLHPELAAPIGTHAGWNVRADGYSEGELCAGSGSFMPFAETRSDRIASGDPRPSLEERYGDHAGYVAAVQRAADRLVEERLLLPADAREIVEQAESSGVLR